MAQVRLLKPYNNNPIGETITVTGGIASVLILQRVGELVKEPCVPREQSPTVDTPTVVSTTVTETLSIGDVSRTVSTEIVSLVPSESDYVRLVDTAKEAETCFREAASGLRSALQDAETERVRLTLLLTERDEEIRGYEATLSDPAICIVRTDPKAREAVLALAAGDASVDENKEASSEESVSENPITAVNAPAPSADLPSTDVPSTETAPAGEAKPKSGSRAKKTASPSESTETPLETVAP